MTHSLSRTLISCSVCLLLLSNQVLAGFAQHVPVDVQLRSNSSVAAGVLKATRFSGNHGQYIGCSITGYGNGSGGRLYCSARDNEGEFLSCYVYNPSREMIDAVRSIKPTTYVSFSKNRASNTCSRIYTENMSTFL